MALLIYPSPDPSPERRGGSSPPFPLREGGQGGLGLTSEVCYGKKNYGG